MSVLSYNQNSKKTAQNRLASCYWNTITIKPLGRISNGIKIKNFLILMVKKSKNGKIKTTSRMSFSRSEIDLFQLLPKMKSRQGWS